MNRSLLLALGLLAAVPAAAQPRLSAGLGAGYAVGSIYGTHGLNADASLGLRWGRLLIGAQPVELGYFPNADRRCVLVESEFVCGEARSQTTLTSSLHAGYVLPVRGALALTAGAGLRVRWHDSLQEEREGESGLTLYVPHLALGVLLGDPGRLNVFVRTETQVLYEIDPGYSSGLDPRLARATVGVTLPLGRSPRR